MFTKFHEDPMKTDGENITICINFVQFKGRNSLVPMPIRLVIELRRDIMPVSIVTMFHEDQIKLVLLTERTQLDAEHPHTKAHAHPFIIYVLLFLFHV